MRITRYLLAISGALLASTAFGQVTPPATGSSPDPAAPAAPPAVPTPAKSVPYGAGMKVNLSPDGSKYLRFIGWTQFWMQYNENNSNTLRDNVQKNDQLAFGLRRTRLITLAQLNPRFLFLLDLGMENQTTISGGVTTTNSGGTASDPSGPGKHVPFYVHNATGEFKVNKYLSIGAGLNYQVGISRMTQASTLNIMTYDLPIVNYPTLDQTDQFGFFMGAYAKGRIGGFDYRVAIDDAFATNQASTPVALRTNVAAFNPRSTSKIYQGYFDYEFFDKEANLLPYQTGTYLGTKRVLNVGAGFHYNPGGTYSRSEAYPTFTATNPAPANFDPYSTTTTHDIRLYGVDVFYDAPIDTASNTAVTFYGVYYNYNFGPNYVRNVGVMNPGNGLVPGATTSAGLVGNAVPLIGTGQSYYAQLGVLLPKNLLGPKVKLQPYVDYLHNSLNGLLDTDGKVKGVNVYDAGLNFYLDGHNAKITLNYRARPDFSNQTFLPANNGAATVNSIRYRPEVTLQTQVYL